MWRTSSARRWSLPSIMRLPGPRRMGLRGAAMELFLKLFGDLLVFVYHCFDRIVIHGYLSGLSRPEQVVHFFRRVVGVPAVTKEVLSQRTADYRCRIAGGSRQAQPGDHSQAARLLDIRSGAEVLRERAQEDQSVALLLDRPDRILPQLHLQAPLPDPQAVRAQLRAGALAADGAQDLRDLRPAAAPQNGRQACHGDRADRARPSRLPCLLQARGPEAVREVLDVPAQRALLQQSQGLRSQEELGQPASGP